MKIPAFKPSLAGRRPANSDRPVRRGCPLPLFLAPLMAFALTACESLSGGASPPGGGAAPGAGSATTAAQAHQRLIDAYNGCNEAAFVGAYAPLFTFITSNTKQPVTTRDGLQRYLGAGCARSPSPNVTLVQQTTRISGAITVFTGQYRFKVPVGGAAGASGPVQLTEVLQNFTVVFERMGERWLVLAHHVSVAP